MSTRLIYVTGPSGAGKDSLLTWLKGQLPDHAPLHWARRTISRPLQAGGEAHEAVTAQAFDQLQSQGAFVLYWQANQMKYGIRQTELAPLQNGRWVLVNGSRGYLAQARERYPGLTVLHVTARADILRRRLLARGRETPEMVEARVQRATQFQPAVGTGLIEIHNNGSLDDAGTALLAALRGLAGWA